MRICFNNQPDGRDILEITSIDFNGCWSPTTVSIPAASVKEHFYNKIPSEIMVEWTQDGEYQLVGEYPIDADKEVYERVQKQIQFVHEKLLKEGWATREDFGPDIKWY